MIKIAIVEDEIEMANDLKRYIDQFFHNNSFQVEITHFNSALKILDNYQYKFNLIFMDINLPVIDGMEAAKTIRKIDSQVMIIFVTSLAQYAINGYEVNAFDFILKPINYYSFSLKMKRALPVLKSKANRTISISNKRNVRVVEISAIKYIEVNDHKLVIHTTFGDFDSFDTLNKYFDLLKNDNFILCNRSYLVNLRYVSEVDQKYAYVGEDALIISRPKRKEFLHAFNIYLGKGGDN